jgi:hypothetical protein
VDVPLAWTNLYQYTLNLPTLFTDPTGHIPLIPIIVGGIVLLWPATANAPGPNDPVYQDPAWHCNRNENNRCPRKKPEVTSCSKDGKNQYGDSNGDPWTYEGQPGLHGNMDTFRGSGPNRGSQCTYDASGDLVNSGPYLGTYDHVSPFNDDGSYSYPGIAGHFFTDVLPHFFDTYFGLGEPCYSPTPPQNVY